MKITRKTEYALKTVMDLAIHSREIVSVPDIARRQGIPIKFLEQILINLKGAGIVASKRGKKGGYYLAKHPSKISLASVVRLSEGALSLLPFSNDTNSGGSGIGREIDFTLKEVWSEINDYMKIKLGETTIQKMCARTAEISTNKCLEYVI